MMTVKKAWTVSAILAVLTAGAVMLTLNGCCFLPPKCHNEVDRKTGHEIKVCGSHCRDRVTGRFAQCP